MSGFLLAGALFVAAQAAPVQDPENVLSDEARQLLVDKLVAHERATAVPVGVFVVTAPEGESMIELADRAMVFFSNGFARKRPGVLVVFAPGSRRLRIAVSEALQRELTTDEIVRFTDDATSAFKAGDTTGGLIALVDAICAEVQTQPSRIRWLPVIAGGAVAGLLAGGLGAFLKRRKAASA